MADKTEREANPADSFDGGYHLHAKEKHKKRVAQSPKRTEHAIKLFKASGIEFTLKNASIGHFHCRRKSDGHLFQFWAGTGKILAHERIRGIHAFIRLLKAEGKHE